jgi:hypothetical protein
MPILPNGIGGTSGNSFVTNKPLYTSDVAGGNVIYVSSSTGSDANTGLSRIDPKATLSSAEGAAVSGDIIVFLANHAETLTAAQTINAKSLTIVGEGTSGGKPTVKFTNNQAAGELLTLTSSNLEIRNIWIEEDAQACSASRVTTNNADNVGFIDCYFECDGNSDASCVKVSGSGKKNIYFKNCTWISTSTAQAAPADNDPPTIGLEVANNITGFFMDGCVFDGGTIGFSDYALKATAAATIHWKVENLSLLRGADAGFNVASTGWMFPTTTTGGARVVFPANTT